MFESFRFMAVFVETMTDLIQSMRGMDILSGEEHGGYLCMLDAKTGEAVLLCPIGSMPKEKVAKYRANAKEKANRLFELSQTDPKQWSSWQSRDEANGKWGGAVRSATFIFSFSGFPQLVDEAFMLVLAMRFDGMPGGAADLIAQISSNEAFQKLRT